MEINSLALRSCPGTRIKGVDAIKEITREYVECVQRNSSSHIDVSVASGADLLKKNNKH